MVDTLWRSVATPDRGGEYLALLSYLPLKGFRKMVTLQRQSGKIRAQLAETPGLIGFSLCAKLLSRYSLTLSIWEDERPLMSFVGNVPHKARLARLRSYWGVTPIRRGRIPAPTV